TLPPAKAPHLRDEWTGAGTLTAGSFPFAFSGDHSQTLGQSIAADFGPYAIRQPNVHLDGPNGIALGDPDSSAGCRRPAPGDVPLPVPGRNGRSFGRPARFQGYPAGPRSPAQ